MTELSLPSSTQSVWRPRLFSAVPALAPFSHYLLRACLMSHFLFLLKEKKESLF